MKAKSRKSFLKKKKKKEWARGPVTDNRIKLKITNWIWQDQW